MISKKDLHTFEERHRVLLQTSEFICLLPHPDLRAYVSNYNVTFPAKAIMPDQFTELPCGCGTIVIESDSSGLYVHLDGPTTKPCVVGLQVNQLEMLVTMEFKPGGLYVLTGINQSELADRSVPYDLIDPVFSRLLSEIAEKAESISELVACIDLLLLENMNTAYHPQLMMALQKINNCAGNVDVKVLSSDVHYSERQLNRIFKQHVGIGAKSLSRLIRVSNSFHLLKKPRHSLTLISDSMGFHDLSHFIRDFRLVCGVKPQEYRSNMSDFYINTIKF